MGDITQDQEDIAVFWDFDSTKSHALNSELQPAEIVHNIRSSLFPYGSIKSFRAYGNFSGQALVRATNVRSDLLASGLTLIDCPNDGRKDLGVKIMLVDMVTHAWNHATPHTFVIISADRDIAYCISTLRMRKYRVLVIHPPGSHSDLKVQASFQLDWNLSILGNAHHDDNFRNGDFFEDVRPPKRPGSFSFNTPAAPGSSAGSYQHQTNNPTNGGGPRTHDQERPASAAADLFELHDLPSRSRRNSMFSSSLRPHKFDVFGDVGTGDVSPKLSRGAFGLGDGPLLPRSQSRFGTPSRPDSVPSNYMYPSVLSKPPYTPQPDKASTDDGMTESTWKGKERSLLEPEVIAPQAPPAATYDSFVPKDILDSPEHSKAASGALSGAFTFSVPYKGVEVPATTEEPFRWKGQERAFPVLEPESVAPSAPSCDPFTSQGLFERPRSRQADIGDSTTIGYPPEQARVTSTTSSTSSSSKISQRSSLPSLDHKAQDSTAPTSADTALSQDKDVNANESTFRDSAMELLYQTFNSVPRTFEQPTRPVDEVQEAVQAPAPKRIPSPPKVEREIQTSIPQVEPLTKAEPQSSSAVNQTASSSSSKPLEPAPKQQNATAGPSNAAAISLPNPGPPPLTGGNAQYQTLVEVLRATGKRASSTITEKSILGAALLKRDSNVYRSQTGSSKSFFKNYIAGAVAAGIVSETNDRQSVRLLPPYAL